MNTHRGNSSLSMLSTTSHRGEEHTNRVSLTLPLSNPDWFPSLPPATRSVAAPPVPLAAEDAPVRVQPAPQKTKLLGFFSGGNTTATEGTRVVPKPPSAVGLAPAPLGASPPRQRPTSSFTMSRQPATSFHSTSAATNHGISWSPLAQQLWHRSNVSSPPPMNALAAPRPIDHRMSSSVAAHNPAPSLSSTSKLWDELGWKRAGSENHRSVAGTTNDVSRVATLSQPIEEPLGTLSDGARSRPRPPMPLSSSPPESEEENRFVSLKQATSSVATDAAGKKVSLGRFPLPLDFSEVPTVSPLLKPKDGEVESPPMTPTLRILTGSQANPSTPPTVSAHQDGLLSFFSSKQKSDIWSSKTAHATLPTFTVTGSSEHTMPSTEGTVKLHSPAFSSSSPIGVHYYDPLSADGLLSSPALNSAFSSENPFELPTSLHFSTDATVNTTEISNPATQNSASDLTALPQTPAVLNSSSARMDDEDDHLDALRLLLQSVMSMSAEEGTHSVEEPAISPLPTWESSVFPRKTYTERVTTFSTMPQWGSQNSNYKAAFTN